MGIKEFFRPVLLMEPDEVRRFIEKHGEHSFTLLDVRQPGEYERFHIPGARLVPLPDLMDYLPRIDIGKPILTCCGSGRRSSTAARLLKSRGFEEIYNIKGGLTAWLGQPAEGPDDLHLPPSQEYDTPQNMIMAAFSMEVGLLEFYRNMRSCASDQDVIDLLDDLVVLEEKHKAALVSVGSGYGISESDFKAAEKRSLLEEGLEISVFVERYKTFFQSSPSLLEVAMMLETQALDLYLHLADAVKNAPARAILQDMAEEERAHLTRLGHALDVKAAATSL
jgi:rhodanese-related sulfurtransferase/rubrerythrin